MTYVCVCMCVLAENLERVKNERQTWDMGNVFNHED